MTIQTMTGSAAFSGGAQAAPGAKDRVPWAALALIAIVILAAGVRLANFDALGEGNLYYTAAVQAMLRSPSNFFFGAADGAGAVTVDKPPVGLWIQAISAAVFGLNGFAVILPQIAAGIGSVLVMYALVKRTFGAWGGLIAAFIAAVYPITIAADRNNTMDSLLIFALLLAAWAFVLAAERGSLRWLILGAVLVGIGFNIKMLQAFLPLPAFFALYFFGARLGWMRKAGHLALAALMLLVVSLSWATIVELTPADQRPYIGSSQTNSVYELILGYNGIERLLGVTPGANSAPPPNSALAQGVPQMITGVRNLPGITWGTQFGNETGEPGVLRLLQAPLSNESAWLLPFALVSIALILAAYFKQNPTETAGNSEARRLSPQLAAVLWGGWLLTGVIFFSTARFFHAYYLAMLTPPIAALTAGGLISLRHLYRRRPLAVVMILIACALGTLAIQLWTAAAYRQSVEWMPHISALFITGTAVLIVNLFLRRASLAAGGFAAIAAAILLTPLIWGFLTTTTANPALPAAYGDNQPFDLAGMAGNMMDINNASSQDAWGADTALLDYLQEQTEDYEYLMAVPSAIAGAPYSLASARPVLYMGGFSGEDPVLSPVDLEALVEAGKLRYVWDQMGMLSFQKPEIAAWLEEMCIADSSAPLPQMEMPDPAQMQAMIEQFQAQGGALPITPLGGSGSFPPPAGSGQEVQPPEGNGMAGAVPQDTLYDCASGGV